MNVGVPVLLRTPAKQRQMKSSRQECSQGEMHAGEGRDMRDVCFKYLSCWAGVTGD